MARLCRLLLQSSNWAAWQLAQLAGASEMPCAARAAGAVPCGARGRSQWRARKREASASSGALATGLGAGWGAWGACGAGSQAPSRTSMTSAKSNRCKRLNRGVMLVCIWWYARAFPPIVGSGIDRPGAGTWVPWVRSNQGFRAFPAAKTVAPVLFRQKLFFMSCNKFRASPTNPRKQVPLPQCDRWARLLLTHAPPRSLVR